MLALLATVALAAPPTCTSWGEFSLLATCDDCPDLNESSGIVWARNRPGVWFTHNDAGGTANLYAFDEAGNHLETHWASGAAFRDWEDIASGPCPEGAEAETCIYIGDVGDNGESRESVDIWVVAEPAAGEHAELVAQWRLTYPVEPHDCEAIAVHPCTGRVYLLTKEREGEPAVFRAPRVPTGPDEVGELEFVATLDRTWLGDSGLITGADWSDGGDRLAVRTYDGGWEWVTDPAEPDAHWSTPPTPIPIDVEGQGESISFHPDGGVLTTTERTPMRIVHLPCDTTEEAPTCPPREDPVDTGDPGDTAESGVPDDTSEPSDTDSGPPADSTPPGDDGDSAEASDADKTDDTCGCGEGSALLWVGLFGFSLRRRRSARRIEGVEHR